MANTKRYDGLQYLKKRGLPVPLFRRISNIKDLNEDFGLEAAPFGWTIRTCKKNGLNEFNLFYKNKISFKGLKELLSLRLNENIDEFYIIYHSWDFDYSFNVIKDKGFFIVEGNLGSQKEISKGSEIPEFSIMVNSDNLTIVQSYLIDPSLNERIGIMRALRLLKKNIDKERYYSEVAITKQKEMFFYEFTDISTL